MKKIETGSSLLVALFLSAYLFAQTTSAKPAVWMNVPSQENGKCFRELFQHPDEWKQTRSMIDVFLYADHNLDRSFTDEELGAWLPMLNQWGIKLGLEVGAIKEWGLTGEKAFAKNCPKWERFERLGGKIYAVAMDEPLCFVRNRAKVKLSDDYAVQETANFIALARKKFPDMLIGDIETYPSIPVPDHIWWIETLQKRLADMGVRGLDFYRLDVNWAAFPASKKSSWSDVKKLELYCRERNLPFSMIYWASDYPALRKKELADDSTWYKSIMKQGAEYAAVGGEPDEYVIESWVQAPSRAVPETDEWTFTRSVRDFCEKFVK